MGGLCKRYGVKKTTRIIQEYSNVKRLHSKLLQETEQGALGIIWGRHKEELKVVQGERRDKNKILRVREKRKTAECWGGEEYLIEWDDGERRWVNKREVEHLEGAEVDLIHRAKELVREVPVTFTEYMVDHGVNTEQRVWGLIWKEFLVYAQQGDRGRSAKENASIDMQREDTRTRESHPTLYPGEVVGENEEGAVQKRRNMRELTGRAKANQQRREKKEETHRNKRIRLAEGEN
eukprot:4313049-Pleurochrysis_carterae.AAC.1